MKTTCLVIACLLACSTRTARSEEVPKLAVAPVQASATLARKFAPSIQADPVSAPPSSLSQGAGMVKGKWRGVWKPGKGGPTPIILRIYETGDHSLQAELENVVGRRTWRAAPVGQGTHFSVDFGVNKEGAGKVDGGVWRADIDRESGKMAAEWQRDGRTFPLQLHPTEPIQSVSLQAGPSAGAGVSPLDEILHSIDVQLVDRFDSARFFKVVEDADARQALSSPGENPADLYNVKTAKSKAQFEKAGIRYVLVTTLEDFVNNTSDVKQVTSANQKGDLKAQRSVRSSTAGGAARAPGGVQYGQTSARDSSLQVATERSQTRTGPQIVKQQEVRVAARYRLYDATTGDLIQRVDHTFATNRAYAVTAQANNAQSGNDLYEAAAKNIAEWAAIMAAEGVFPIKVLEKGEKEITINRGMEAGLQVGHVFNVYALGKEIKDPSSGEVLGREELTVGRVAVSELHEKFSKATILEDKNITLGGSLRRLSK